jgi:hypothetical protein
MSSSLVEQRPEDHYPQLRHLSELQTIRDEKDDVLP